MAKVELPDFRKKVEDMTDQEISDQMKKMNVFPQRQWQERSLFLHATGGLFEPYVPPEGDGKVSPISKQVS